MNSNITWEKHDVIPDVWVGDSGQSGNTVAIFGGVHGDEQTGIKVVEQSKEVLNLDAGTVYLALGNPTAIAINKRATKPGNNLNREFKDLDSNYVDTDPDTWPEEVRRAQQLLPLLRESRALLDLHDFSDPNGPIFIITEERGFGVARAIGAPIISSGWSTAEPGGSDAFMESLEKVGICYELGYKAEPEKVLERGHDAVARFLIANEMLEGNLPPLFTDPRFIHNSRAFKRHTEDYELLLPRGTRTFDTLQKGQEIARLDGKVIEAQEGQVVIFPMSPESTPIGTEAFSLGHIFTPAA
ncbi:MAG TPA: succinylglutamate desuccinylase/aspartoacylase family protein [Patescibacteria group bacterium]|nr:succinylglutamate desuccinylase/aspartoacylase family protein [Patescibacteria group bacterium]